jgi:beta-lactamase superfamily II metal-dependent hydrolase
MTLQVSKAGEPRAPSGCDKATVEVHLFECGQGDTILIGLPENKWALLDCHLPSRAARERFFAYTDRLGVHQLDVLFLTHSDRDHYAGMGDVVRHFTSDGRSIQYFCDIGDDPKSLLNLFLGLAKAKDLPPGQHGRRVRQFNELQELIRQINELLKKELIKEYYPLNRNTRPLFYAEDAQGRPQVKIMALAPDPTTIRLMKGHVEERLKLSASVNVLSLVLVLQAQVGDKSLHVLFAGDAEKEGLEEALRVWHAYEGNGAASLPLDMIKVAHHGALGSHSALLPARRRQGAVGVAAISAGTAYRVHPDRVVLNDYLAAGWKVLVTNKRQKPSVKHRVFQLADQSGKPYHLAAHDLCITWDTETGLVGVPAAAAVQHHELKWYDSARKAP